LKRLTKKGKRMKANRAFLGFIILVSGKMCIPRKALDPPSKFIL